MKVYGKHNVGFLIIDSPYSGLDEGENEILSENMKNSLLSYMANHLEDGQTIIVENKKNIEYEYLMGVEGVKIIDLDKTNGFLDMGVS